MPEITLIESDGESDDDGSTVENSAGPERQHPASASILPRDLDSSLCHPGAVVPCSKAAANEAKADGNRLFAAKKYAEAIERYSDALDLAPADDDFSHSRAVFLSNRAACSLHLEHNDDVISDCSAALELSPRYVKALMRRGQAYESLDDLEAALADANAAVEIDPGYQPARQAQVRLDEAVTKKHEEMKDEMLGKLKDLGNTVLGKFGLSMDNFKINQDPNSGSYSVNFEQ